jgi:hypothetical protein
MTLLDRTVDDVDLPVRPAAWLTGVDLRPEVQHLRELDLPPIIGPREPLVRPPNKAASPLSRRI